MKRPWVVFALAGTACQPGQGSHFGVSGNDWTRRPDTGIEHPAAPVGPAFAGDVPRIGLPTLPPIEWTPRTVPTDPELTVAFLGDQGVSLDAMLVLEFLALEAPDLVVWLGDFDYEDSPAIWKLQMDTMLGADQPWLAVIGNHDVYAWDGYEAVIDAHRADAMPDVECTGETGVKQACTFRGLELVLSGVGTSGDNHDDFIVETLAPDDHIWRICAWHKNQQDMQVGAKTDEVGWGVLRYCQEGAAIVTMGHEHSYSRTLTLSDVGNADLGHGAFGPADTLLVSHGTTFATVAGTAGQDYRDFEAELHAKDTWWASYYTSNLRLDQGVVTKLQEPAIHGALFITFNVAGDPHRAEAEFKTRDGQVIDAYTIFSL